MKYEFIKKDEDTTILKYKDKEFEFIRDVSLMINLQSINFTARNKMLKDLAKQGMTVGDLITVEKKNGKTYENDTNVRWIERRYIIEETTKLFDKCCNKFTKMGMSELMEDIGISEPKDSAEFGNSLREAIMGTYTPSEEKAD